MDFQVSIKDKIETKKSGEYLDVKQELRDVGKENEDMAPEKKEGARREVKRSKLKN